MTIGEKIREIRIFRGYTQAELGGEIGLTGDRIRQYENNVRKPKPELLKKIIKVLDVNSAAISDLDLKNENDIMHFLFWLEDKYNLTINKNDNKYSLTIEPNEKNKCINQAFDAWYKAKQNITDDCADKEKAYQNWKYQMYAEF